MSRTRIRQIRSSDVTVCGAVLGDGPGEEYLEDHYASDHSAFPIPATTSARRFVYGRYIDEPVVMLDDTVGSTPDTYYYHQNHRYDVVALTNSAGAIVEAYEYDPYGRHVLIEDGDTYPDGDSIVNFDNTDTRTEYGVSSLGNPYTFTGRRYDGEVTTYNSPDPFPAGHPGLHHFRNRYYSAERGRFISPDPIGIWGDGYNRGNGYGYVGGMAMNAVDPYGLEKSFLERLREWFDGLGAYNKPIDMSNSTGTNLLNKMNDGYEQVAPYAEAVADTAVEFVEEEIKDPWNYVPVAGGLNKLNDGRKALDKLNDLRKLNKKADEACEVACKASKKADDVVDDVADKVDDVTWETKKRQSAGGDGGQSQHKIEKENRETVSKVHQVYVDGKLVHQHQDHVGKYGGQRKFPEEWTEFPDVDKKE